MRQRDVDHPARSRYITVKVPLLYKYKQNIIIIEDEVPAARLLAVVFSRCIQSGISPFCRQGKRSCCMVRFHPASRPYLLDIQLADGNSFDFLSGTSGLRSLFSLLPTTSMLSIRTVNSIDYILKPVDEQRLLDAIVKYETYEVT